MKLIITKHIQKELSQYHLGTSDLVKHFENTYLGSNKCFKITEFEWMFDMYKSYITGIDRLVSFITFDHQVIIPVFVGDKSHPIARNIIKKTLMMHARIRHHKAQYDIANNDFETIYLHH